VATHKKFHPQAVLLREICAKMESGSLRWYKTAEVKTRYKISNYTSCREKFHFLFSQQAAGTQKTPPGSRLAGSFFHISRGSAFKQSAQQNCHQVAHRKRIDVTGAVTTLAC